MAAGVTMGWVALARVVEYAAGFGLVEWYRHDGSWGEWLVDLEFILWDMDAWTSVSGSVIAGVWVVLLASRHWKREPGWIDGLGLGFGVYWIVAAPFAWFADLPD
jgi:hypothetical protein